MAKSDKIVELAHKKSEDSQKAVLKVIAAMKCRGEKISFYAVAQTAGVSKSYLYSNENLRQTIEAARNEGAPKEKRTVQSKDAIIRMQKARIKELESAVQQLQDENADSYKQKYELLLTENTALKRQLKMAYNI